MAPRTKYDLRADLGRFAEMHFASEAYRRGYEIYLPPQSMPYVDCIVAHTDGRLLRVQIKAASAYARGKLTGMVWNCSGTGRKYDRTRFDVLACYRADSGSWNFLPSSAVHGRSCVYEPVERMVTRRASPVWSSWAIFGVPPVSPIEEPSRDPILEPSVIL